MQREMNMNSKCCTVKLRQQKMLEETKRFFHTAFRNIKSFVLGACQNLHRNPHGGDDIDHKLQLQKVEKSNLSFSRQPDPGQVVNRKEGSLRAPKGHSMLHKGYNRSSRHSGLEDSKEEMKAKQGEPSFLATENFAQKIEELEMIDVNNRDHVQDIEEVIHHYSLLKSPAYLDIVDNFFTDMYLELYLTQPSRSVNSSMRKLDSTSVHGSMRKPGSASIHGSMRKPGSASIHGSMRKLDSTSIHGSMRKHGSSRVHGSMRKLGSASTHSSMRKLGTTSVHCSMRNLGRLKL